MADWKNAAFLACACMAACFSMGLAARTPPAARRVRGSTLTHNDLDAEANLSSSVVALHASVVRKPPKGWRKMMGERAKKVTVEGNMDCGKTYAVSSADDPMHRCPEECPFFAQDKRDDLFCTFRCVEDAEQCKAMNPKTIIPDMEHGICRSPMVQFCKEYNWDGTDTCKVCNAYYSVGSDGQCYSKLWVLIQLLGIVLLVVVIALVWWITDMSLRPMSNFENLKDALTFRSFQKLRTSKEDGRQMWPLSTNLLRQTVAGPGMMLHFNFQFFAIVWGALIAVGWMVLAALVDPALFVLGTKSFGPPRDNCILVAWGFEKQQGLMWSKVLFLFLAYLMSFTLALLHSVRQLRIFQLFDYQNKTMKDFVAMCDGLPAISGSDRLEEKLQKRIQEATGETPVGVSVCWDFRDRQSEVMTLLEKDMIKADSNLRPPPGEPGEEAAGERKGVLRKHFYTLEDKVFGTAAAEPEMTETEVKELLAGIGSSPCCFVVFSSEASLKQALQNLESGYFEYEGHKVSMKAQLSEPDTVEWQNFGHSKTEDRLIRLLKGFGAIFLALVFWTVVFYLPYAASVFNFNYDNGQEPGIVYGLAFSMVVVVGNQIMYEVCARVSESVGFYFKDTKAVCYMILFTVACLYNVLVDMVTTYYMAEKIMMELGFRTYYGQKLTEVPTFTDRFETYAMQRSLAENTFAYAFPSTYLVPFLLEPLATILVPLLLGALVLRSHSEIGGRDAEGLVASIPMDMGRYADILLNMVLGILIFYFPGGYTHKLFLGLAGSHVFIYFFDHCRVLRTVPQITIATMDVDWWSQLLLAPVVALVLSCLIFKANCQDYGFCLEGATLIFTCGAAFALHCIVHSILLIYVVPMLGKPAPEEDPCAHVTFKDVAEIYPTSWFTSNPVHCLRSQHIFKHNPPCKFVFSGKEHLLKKNEKIGCFFEDTAPEPEDWSVLVGRKAKSH